MSTIELRLKEDVEGPIIRMDKDPMSTMIIMSLSTIQIQTRAEVGKSALTTYC